MDFDQILGEACFVTNALLTVNNCTPYNAVYGRVPHILPSIDQPDCINEASLDHPGMVRHCYRLREIAVQAMIEETASVRAQRPRATAQAALTPMPYRARALDTADVGAIAEISRRNGFIASVAACGISSGAVFLANSLSRSIGQQWDHRF